jgi:hypothetical protein
MARSAFVLSLLACLIACGCAQNCSSLITVTCADIEPMRAQCCPFTNLNVSMPLSDAFQAKIDTCETIHPAPYACGPSFAAFLHAIDPANYIVWDFNNEMLDLSAQVSASCIDPAIVNFYKPRQPALSLLMPVFSMSTQYYGDIYNFTDSYSYCELNAITCMMDIAAPEDEFSVNFYKYYPCTLSDAYGHSWLDMRTVEGLGSFCDIYSQQYMRLDEPISITISVQNASTSDYIDYSMLKDFVGLKQIVFNAYAQDLYPPLNPVKRTGTYVFPTYEQAAGVLQSTAQRLTFSHGTAANASVIEAMILSKPFVWIDFIRMNFHLPYIVDVISQTNIKVVSMLETFSQSTVSWAYVVNNIPDNVEHLFISSENGQYTNYENYTVIDTSMRLNLRTLYIANVSVDSLQEIHFCGVGSNLTRLTFTQTLPRRFIEINNGFCLSGPCPYTYSMFDNCGAFDLLDFSYSDTYTQGTMSNITLNAGGYFDISGNDWRGDVALITILGPLTYFHIPQTGLYGELSPFVCMPGVDFKSDYYPYVPGFSGLCKPPLPAYNKGCQYLPNC